MFEKDFETMLRQYGDAIDDKKKFKGLMKDCFPAETRILNLILLAYDLEIAVELQTTDSISNAFAYRFVKQLTDDYGLSRSNADWAVSVWCVCYGKNILHKECDISIQKDHKPAIIDEKPTGNMTYGDLFAYAAGTRGEGLAVVGFKGASDHTVIFQNTKDGKSVVEIGESLFEGKDIEEVIITEGYRYFGKRAFADATNLRQVVMPYTMIEIGDESFAGCSSLKRINLTERLERIGDWAFKGTGLKTVVFPHSVYYVGKGAFADCLEIDNVTIPAEIEMIPDEMFFGCINLKKIELSEGIRDIGDNSFRGCSSLDIITIPDSVIKIGNSAFAGVDDRFIIQCSFGSYAESYARAHSIKYQFI